MARSHAIFALTFTLALAGCGNASNEGEQQPVPVPFAAECGETLAPGDDLQAALDRARPGALLCLDPGAWTEHVTVRKRVVLRGMGDTAEDVSLESREEGRPIVLIEGTDADVRLEHLTVTGAGTDTCAQQTPKLVCSAGVQLTDGAHAALTDVIIAGNRDGVVLLDTSSVELNRSRVTGSVRFGLLLWDGAEASVRGSVLSGNGRAGAGVHRFAALALQNATVADNAGDGVRAVGQVRVRVEGSSLRDNADNGVFLGSGGASLSLVDATVSGNGVGVRVESASTFSAFNATISDNARHGVTAGHGRGTVTIENSTVRGNGTDPACARADTLCNGLQFAQEPEVVLDALTVQDNADWGIAVHASACGFAYDDFDGEVVLDGDNTLEGNNASGNQDGAGNPGPPPYATLPDGQICLP